MPFLKHTAIPIDSPHSKGFLNLESNYDLAIDRVHWDENLNCHVLIIRRISDSEGEILIVLDTNPYI